ncbi:MAG: flavin reductase [Coriobacteriales bacterium]|jgi:flavin reductase (DIM6/NTAB) family NADH-FMN oxidoreductase RutF
MSLHECKIEDLSFNPFDKIANQWMLICAGDEKKANAMTASWGGVGVWWGKPAATCYIRQTRYTKEFVDAKDTFSLCFLKDADHDAHKVFGSVSGRDCDKFAETGMTLTYIDGTPVVAESELVFICKKEFAQFMPRESFVDAEAYDRWYSTGGLKDNFHTMYIGAIEKVLQA